MNYKIIGLCGQSEVGKDTCADIIVGLEKNSIKLSFDDLVVKEVSESFGLDTSFFMLRDLKEQKSKGLIVSRSDNEDFIEYVKTIIGTDLFWPRSPAQLIDFWKRFRAHQDASYRGNAMLNRLHEVLREGYKVIVINDLETIGEANLLINFNAKLVMFKSVLDKSSDFKFEYLKRLEPHLSLTLTNNKSIEALVDELQGFLTSDIWSNHGIN